MAWIWMLIGALIGVVVWQRKGINPALAVIVGVLLGPLAFLMLFASSGGAGGGNVKCPHCAEWIKADARVCKHCHREVTRAATAATSTTTSRPKPKPPTSPVAGSPGYGGGMKR